MPGSTSCIPVELLHQFALGRVPEPELERLEQHLAQCKVCLQTLENLQTHDELLENLAQAPAVLRAQGTVVEDLKQRLRILPAADRSGEPTATDRLMSTEPPLPSPLPLSRTDLGAREGTEGRYDGLAPPQEAGELGRLGSYRVVKVLGSGGMGVVYQAWQDHPRRLVALKLGQAHRWRARLLQETDLVGRLQHPHIVPVYEAGEHHGLPYFTMELLDGGNLAQQLATALLAPQAAAALVETLARAVQFAHQRGIVHRDLKPSNVLLTRDGVAKIGDFGLAKLVESDQEPVQPGCRTESGALLGTPNYMAPEQAAGHSKEIGPAADVYALGAILYECLTGRPPFRAATVIETLDQVRSQEPVPPGRLQPGVPRDLQTICLKCLEKAPARRYASAEELADDLGRFQRGEPIRARPVSWRERGWKWARRKPALAALLVVSGLSLATLVAGDQIYSARLRAAVKQAEASAAEADRQRTRADAGYRGASEALDRMLKHLERRRVGEVPQLKELQRDQCEDALAFYQSILGGADDPAPAIRLDAARAFQRAATLQALLSRPADAVQSFGRAIDLVEALPASQRDLPEAQERLADCYSDRGLMGSDPAQRERDVGKALAIKERLAQAQPDDPGRQNSRATTEHQVGMVLMGASRPADAEPHVARAVAIRTQLIQDHPQEETYQDALAGDYVNLGVIYGATGRGDELFALHDKVEALLRPLIARHPENIGRTLTLAAAEINWGQYLLGKGKKQDALEWCNEAVKVAEEALQREPNHYMAGGITLNAHGARAQINEALRRWSDAATDWERVIELDGGKQRWVHRVLRAMNLAAAGDHARATAEADALIEPETNGEGLWGLAIIYARSLPAVRSDSQLSSAERDALAERYASRAVALLRRLQAEDYFKDPGRAKALRTDADLKALGDRDDFRKLLEDVGGGKDR
jgi:tetratricopeptide (TPR) repeat protein